ncbi:hypothetical protein B0T17DRAFT_509748 [Bombardia bombarda]|uniref:Uncharacterized protein n=1 Tax=Bombardia bombarda TaxID=252184 RepID=A0AA39WML5_9PEZI|nr:hypothetical protein B0T17DRAFT_509748 [Bombardia bombarda]
MSSFLLCPILPARRTGQADWWLMPAQMQLTNQACVAYREMRKLWDGGGSEVAGKGDDGWVWVWVGGCSSRNGSGVLGPIIVLFSEWDDEATGFLVPSPLPPQLTPSGRQACFAGAVWVISSCCGVRRPAKLANLPAPDNILIFLPAKVVRIGGDPFPYLDKLDGVDELFEPSRGGWILRKRARQRRGGRGGGAHLASVGYTIELSHLVNSENLARDEIEIDMGSGNLTHVAVPGVRAQ